MTWTPIDLVLAAMAVLLVFAIVLVLLWPPRPRYGPAFGAIVWAVMAAGAGAGTAAIVLSTTQRRRLATPPGTAMPAPAPDLGTPACSPRSDVLAAPDEDTRRAVWDSMHGGG